MDAGTEYLIEIQWFYYNSKNFKFNCFKTSGIKMSMAEAQTSFAF